MILFEIAFEREAKLPNRAVVFLRFVRDEGHLSKFNKSQLYLKKKTSYLQGNTGSHVLGAI